MTDTLLLPVPSRQQLEFADRDAWPETDGRARTNPGSLSNRSASALTILPPATATQHTPGDVRVQVFLLEADAYVRRRRKRPER